MPISASIASLPQAQLDHIIILIPLDALRDPPKWLRDNFTITPGGQHADGLTENILVLLSDGVYLEFIAFSETTTPEQRAEHWWGKKEDGIVDYAFTFPSEDYDRSFEFLRTAWKDNGVEERWIPPRLIPGGRQRPDGVRVEWKVGFPEIEERGTPNFWCFDVTPREYRVPMTDSSVKHACGATGVATVTVGGEKGVMNGLKQFFGSYLHSEEDSTYEIDTPDQKSGAGIGLEEKIGRTAIRLALHTTGEKKTIRGELGGQALEIALV